MITYVNTVLVSNKKDVTLEQAQTAEDLKKLKIADAGKLVYQILDNDADTKTLETADSIRIGLVTNKENVLRTKDPKTKVIKTEKVAIIKWSNAIHRHDIKSLQSITAENEDVNKASSEDEVKINFAKIVPDVMNKLAEGGKRIIVRLTFKDLPTRYRKWTESYEYVTMLGDNAETIAAAIAGQINGEWKRARVAADPEGGVLTLKALPYDDDNDFDTINWAGKVRFNANVYFTDPAAEGWESLNKHYPQGLVIEKTPGKTYPATGKLVRDRENQAYGYQGILNRGCCTWPIIQPERQAQDDKVYDAVTLEFENMYRAADDIFRKTKQTVEIYTPFGTGSGIATALEPFVKTAAGHASINDEKEFVKNLKRESAESTSTTTTAGE